MAFISKYTASVTTTTGSPDLAYTTNVNGGAVVGVRYAGNISTTATLEITGETNGQDILTSLALGATSFDKYVGGAVVNTTNGAIANTYAKVPVVGERIKVSVAASSAASQTGTFTIFVEGA